MVWHACRALTSADGTSSAAQGNHPPDAPKRLQSLCPMHLSGNRLLAGVTEAGELWPSTVAAVLRYGADPAWELSGCCRKASPA